MTLQDYFADHVQLQNEWNYTRNNENPHVLTTRSRAKVWWCCENGHEWQATLDSRVYARRGCPYCSNKAVIPGENDLATVVPEIAKLWHPLRNGDLSPTDLSPGSSKKVWWQCEEGHEWQARIYSVKAGTGCPYCSGRNPIPGKTDLATTHPHFIKMWSPKNKRSPSQVTAGSHKKVLWVCDKGHEWEAMVGSVVMDGCGCPYCTGKLAISGQTDLATVCPDVLFEWDYERNVLNPSEILPSSHDKVWWKCNLGHSWEAVVFSRTRERATGCPYCTGRKVLPGFNDLATLKPKVSQQWYQPLNGTLKPENVTLGSNKKVWWQCREGHVWQAFIYARAKKNGTGCPVCAGTVKPRKVGTLEAKRKKRTQPPVRQEKSIASMNL